MPPVQGRDMQAIEVEIDHLKNGQDRIEHSISSLSQKLDRVGDALVSLVRLTEKHDALVDRVKSLEKSSAEREDVAHTGKAYMAAAKYLAPLALIVLSGLIGWVADGVKNHETRLKDLEVSRAENHPRQTR